MVKVTIKGADRKPHVFYPNTARQLLEHVRLSDYFGAGTLRTETGDTLGHAFQLVDDATYFFFSAPGAQTAGSSAVASEPKHTHPCLPVKPPDTKLSDAFQRVNRLKLGTETIGTAVRLDDGLVLVARHCVVSEGKVLGDLTAFDAGLKFVGANPSVDLALFEGQAGPHFEIASALPEVGQAVTLLSFPLPYDEELKTDSASPALDTGFVSQVDGRGKIAIATLGSAMPNSSGGAMLSDTQTLTGVHLGLTFHLAEAPGTTTTPSAEVPDILEQDADEMWEAEDEGPIAAAAASTEAAAELSRLNIEHKGSAGVFVPSFVVWGFLHALKRVPGGPLEPCMRQVLGLGKRQKRK